MNEFEKIEGIIMDKENKNTDVARQEIRAVYTDETTRVYQAYKRKSQNKQFIWEHLDHVFKWSRIKNIEEIIKQG